MLEREIAALKRELHGARGLAEAERQTVFFVFYFVYLCIHRSINRKVTMILNIANMHQPS